MTPTQTHAAKLADELQARYNKSTLDAVVVPFWLVHDSIKELQRLEALLAKLQPAQEPTVKQSLTVEPAQSDHFPEAGKMLEPVQAAFKALADSQVQIDPEIAKATAEGFWTMFEPVQAGELPDEREAQKVSLMVLCAIRDVHAWHPNMLKDIDFAIQANRAALAARKPLSEDDALELVSLHQKAVFELAKDMSDDNYQIVVQTRLALLNALRTGRDHGIGLEVKHG